MSRWEPTGFDVATQQRSFLSEAPDKFGFISFAKSCCYPTDNAKKNPNTTELDTRSDTCLPLTLDAGHEVSGL